jgi:hypothetical protein
MARATRTHEVPPTDDGAMAPPEVAPADADRDPGEFGGGMAVEVIAVGDLHLDPGNVRRHPAKNLAAIKASLARFDQQKPIVVDANNVVRAGNGLLEAARELGWPTVKVVRSELGSVDLVAYSLSDNRTAELSEWNFEGLAETIRALQAEDFDISSLGWDDHELEPILAADWTPPAVEPLPTSRDGDGDGDGADELIIDATGNEPILRAIAKAREVAGNPDLPPLRCLEIAADAFVMAEVL